MKEKTKDQIVHAALASIVITPYFVLPFRYPSLETGGTMMLVWTATVIMVWLVSR